MIALPCLSNGGAERVASIWASELEKMNVNVSLLLFYRVENEYKINTLVKIHSLSESKEEFNKLSIIKSIFKIRNILKKEKPDVIVSFLYFVGIMTNLARIGLGIKLIETIRSYPSISPGSKLKRGLRNISVLLSEGVIIQNKRQGEYFPKLLRGKFKVFPNPISEDFLTENTDNKSKKIKNLIAVGRLAPQKNFEMLIKGFAKINNSDLNLLIFGEGELENDLNDLIFSLGLSKKVQLKGRTNDILSEMKKADMYILTSDFEGMPNSLMEAMAVGLPSISTDCPTGPSDLINNGDNGILIPVNDEAALVKAINYLTLNTEKAQKIGNQAKEDMSNRHSPSMSAKKLYHYLSVEI